MDSSRILVLSQGEVAEFDTPAALLANPDSVFAGMVAASRADGAMRQASGGDDDTGGGGAAAAEADA